MFKGEKLPTLVIGPFTQENLASYAEVSGDSNPLHLNRSLAQNFGFSSCPVHGMLLLSAFERYLCEWRSDLVLLSLNGQFLTPVLEGECATLSGRVAKIEIRNFDEVGMVRLMAHTEYGVLALVGDARVTNRKSKVHL
jgi:acyl dehydratase